MPSTTVAPVADMDPPFAGIPLTVEKSRAVSKSHMIFPVVVSCARICPSMDGENTTPGMTVGGAFTATEHPRCPAQPGVGAGSFHTRAPVAGANANNPVFAGGAGGPGGAGGAASAPAAGPQASGATAPRGPGPPPRGASPSP